LRRRDGRADTTYPQDFVAYGGEFGCDGEEEIVPVVAVCVHFYDDGSRLLAQCGIIPGRAIVDVDA
jgi:hypothetical protein